MSEQIMQIISQLKNGELCIRNIPKKYEANFDIIKTERELGLRKVNRCGYDAIIGKFFVEEALRNERDKWFSIEPRFFYGFESYSKYLEGNVYENACYYLLDPQKVPKSIDQERLYKKKSFISNTIDEYTFLPTVVEQAQYIEGEKRKDQVKRWIKKFNDCSSFYQLKKTVKNYEKSVLCNEVDVSFYFWNYIFKDVADEDRFEIIMDYMSSGLYPEFQITPALCTIYPTDVVIEKYDYEMGSYQTRNKRIREIKRIAEKIIEGEYTFKRWSFFDDTTHFFCVRVGAFEEGKRFPSFSYERSFEKITDFIEFLNWDLRDCDLSKAQGIDYDFTHCFINETTMLPIGTVEKCDYHIEKIYKDGVFAVTQKWKNKYGRIVKEYEHIFEYFCDFVAFLNGDLSNADLATCNGLIHIIPPKSMSVDNALITSRVCKKWGVEYDPCMLNSPSEISFAFTEQNEVSTALTLQSTRELAEYKDDEIERFERFDSPIKRIYYISDLHLYHLVKNKRVKNEADIIKVIRTVAETIICESEIDSIILIDGDTSLDFSLFRAFVTELKKASRTYIFTIGNHDLWSCPNDTIDQLADKYRELLQTNGMFLIHNDVLYFSDFFKSPERITEEEIKHSSVKELRNRVRTAKLILFGGTGFAGYNELYNAEIGLYRYNTTIGCDRGKEIKETKRFETLYVKICAAFCGKNTVIMTHMPLTDWYGPAYPYRDNDYPYSSEKYHLNNEEDLSSMISVYQPGFVYVSGHTHRNYYFDDSEIRIYADNQFGYNNATPSAWPHLKYFEIDKRIDYFADYDDGIYEITAEDYRQFYRGNNIKMDFNRRVNVIYMLKKSGYYCFIHKGKNNSLSIMNGGALCGLENREITFYYDKMDLVIKLIKEPLDEYTKKQRSVAEVIKKLGGSGTIHGCIIDINFYNHIYINPEDGTITGYWASNIIDKLVYPTVPALLKAQCPRMYNLYRKKIKGEAKEELMVISGQSETQLAHNPVPYFDTDIYSASRQIKKMQKLELHILSTWPNRLPTRGHLEEKEL